MSALSHLVRLLRPRWITVLFVLASMAITSLTTALYAWLAGPLVGTLRAAADGHAVSHPDIPIVGSAGTASELAMILAGLVVTTAIVRGLASFAQSLWLARLQQDAIRDLRVEVYEHLLSVVPSAMIGQAKGELGAQVSADVRNVESLINFALAPLVGNTITAIALTWLLFDLDPLLAAVALVGLPPVIFVVARVSRRIREAYKSSYQAQSRIAGNVAEMAGNVALVRAYEAEGPRARAFEAQADHARDAALTARRASALLGPVVGAVGALAVGGTLVFATHRLADAGMAPEAYVSFFAALFFLYRPVQGLGGAAGFASSGLAALDRVSALLALEREADDPRDAVPIAPMEDHLELRDVTFAYADRPILRGVNLRLQRGQSLAIVGPSGEGKTTLLLILLGILRPTSGDIFIDRAPVARAARASVRRQLAWVPQEPVLFADTILKNVALGDARPDRDRAQRALEMAGAARVVEALPLGLDTLVAEGGADLSVGERQRICVARALYRRAPILLLDEPTASLDGAAEAELGRTIDALLAGESTVILVSHRQSTVRRADRVVVLVDGVIAEDGSPEDLWQRHGAFRTLFPAARPDRDSDVRASSDC